MSDDEDPLATVGSGAAWIFGGRVVKLGLLFLVEVAMARLLGVSSYGGIVLAIMVLNVTARVADLGLGGGITRKLPKYEEDTARARGVVRQSLAIGVASSCVFAAALFVAAPTIARVVFESPETTRLFRIAALVMPFLIVGRIGVDIAKSVRDASTRVIVDQLTKPVLRAVLVPGLIAAGYRATGAMGGIAASILVGAAVALALAVRQLPFSLRGPTVPMSREMVSFSVPLMLASGTMLVFHNTDTFLLGWFLSPDDVGVYNIAFKLQNLGMFFFYPVSFLLPPVLTRLQQEERQEEMDRTYKIVTKWMALPTFFVTAVVVLFPTTIIQTTFGNAYLGGANALRILMVSVFVTTLLGANGAALVALGHNKINMYVNGGVAVLNIGLNLVLIPAFGITGAAAATTTSAVTRDLLYSLKLYQWHSIHPLSGAMIRPMLGTTPFLVGAALLLDATVGDSLTTVAAASLAAAAVFGVIAVRFGAIETEDVRVFSRFEQSVGVDLGNLRSVIKRIGS